MNLSIVIAAYDMQRELPRTLVSALPPCQKEVEDIEYEIIIVDNGSPEPIETPSDLSRRIPIKYLRIPPSAASSSPVRCINEAISNHARGRNLLVCIDGARMFSPFLIRRTVDSLERYPSAFTYVASRHLGEETQMKSAPKGYNQETEDRLLETVDWMEDLDALWDISVWAGAHKDGSVLSQNESNAVGLSRNGWFEVGGFDERFLLPGGGLCNLEFFSRVVKRNNALNILLLGEATFHQYHGGAATSSSGYFGDSLGEHKEVTGAAYQKPEYEFLVDVGAKFGRLQKTAKFTLES